jgi:hypothetical protein
LIDLIVELLGLIIKPFDNQTESWNPVSTWNDLIIKSFDTIIVVYYESINRDLKIRWIYECRCDERLQTKTTEFTRLGYTGLVVELERLKIETRLIDEKFANTMGEYVTIII